MEGHGENHFPRAVSSLDLAAAFGGGCRGYGTKNK
jgi:hypothetical protein